MNPKRPFMQDYVHLDTAFDLPLNYMPINPEIAVFADHPAFDTGTVPASFIRSDNSVDYNYADFFTKRSTLSEAEIEALFPHFDIFPSQIDRFYVLSDESTYIGFCH